MIAELVKDTGSLPGNTERIHEVVSTFYREYDLTPDKPVQIVTMNDAGIREIKKRAFGRDETTDVVSMMIDEEFDDGYLWAEIYVSTETAKREAAARGTAWEDELVLYIVHGLLHLVGFEDETDRERTRMWDEQIDFLSRCGYDPDTFLKE